MKHLISQKEQYLPKNTNNFQSTYQSLIMHFYNFYDNYILIIIKISVLINLELYNLLEVSQM